jgi:hypothetical protein
VRDASPFFPPGQIVQIKAIACELPARHGQPLSRLFTPDIRRIAVAEKIVESISTTQIWRILDEDALKPWRHRPWVYPRDPLFYERAAPVLDLYQGIWKGKPLGARDQVICADEKPSIQVLRRIHQIQIGRDRRGLRVEHEYVRKGVWAYITALDIFRPRVFGRVEETTGIVPFMRLVDQVMRREPYASARRVFWVVDGGCSHHRNTFPDRLRDRYRNAIAVILPVHASWLNQDEIYFSIVQRKVLTPNDFMDRDQARQNLRGFEKIFNKRGGGVDWSYSRRDLRRLLKSLEEPKTTRTVRTFTRNAA